MRRDSLAFLIVGFTIGFTVFYLWTKQREPQIVSAMPTRLLLPSNGGAAPPPDAQAQTPPVDPAEVQRLQDRIKANPKDFEALVSLGNIGFDQRNYPEAAEYYKKALAIHDDLNVRTDLGTMLFYSNHYDEAMTELNKVLAVNPNHAQALFNIGVVYLHGKNDPQKALEIWQKLVDTNPDFPEIGVVKQQIQALKDSAKK
jgi:cytochrome c-type biogenesis protein CcmH/NrfG